MLRLSDWFSALLAEQLRGCDCERASRVPRLDSRLTLLLLLLLDRSEEKRNNNNRREELVAGLSLFRACV